MLDIEDTPKIILVAAMNKERAIGIGNSLPWHIPEDLAYFKRVTLNKPIIMGRKTFESIGRALPGRRNIVISRNADYNHKEIEVFADIKLALAALKDYQEICIIGGGEIFKQTLPLASKLHLTLVDMEVANPDAFFPEIDSKDWQLINSHDVVTKSGIKCSFNEYIRR